MEGYKSRMYILCGKLLKYLCREMEARCRSCYRAAMLRKNGLITTGIFLFSITFNVWRQRHISGSGYYFRKGERTRFPGKFNNECPGLFIDFGSAQYNRLLTDVYFFLQDFIFPFGSSAHHAFPLYSTLSVHYTVVFSNSPVRFKAKYFNRSSGIFFKLDSRVNNLCVV